jgi:predicted ester cyclase
MTAINSGPLAGLPPSNKQITQHGVVFYRFENNKIAEVWLQVDRLGVFQQIGVEIPGAAPALHTR